MSDVSVVHLVRKQNGVQPLAQFLTAYRATHRQGPDAELVLACKGFDDVKDLMAWRGMWEDLKPRILRCPDQGFDIGTYRRVADVVQSEYVCFLNSWSRPLVPGWLAMMLRAARTPGVGIVGCTGSLEAVPLPGWPAFPNPHIRSNAFLLKRMLFRSLDIEEPKTKLDANALEAGVNSITRQVLARGLVALVVQGPPGFTHQIKDSVSFRWEDQEYLLVADNRTDDYQHATPERRRFLQQLAWGETE